MESESIAKHLHNLLWYLPVIFFAGTLVADICYYRGRAGAFKVGHWLIIVGAICCIPAISTGLAAAVNFDLGNQILQKHRSLGFATGISGSLYAGLRISAMFWVLPLKPIHYVFLSVLLLALALWTADLGGLL